MAIRDRVFRVNMEVSDVDRGVFDTIGERVARHTSESDVFFLLRLLSRALEHAEGIEFVSAICEPNLPALAVRNLRAEFVTWIDIGVPSAKRVKYAVRNAEHVVIYSQQPEATAVEVRQGRPKHAPEIRIVSFDNDGFRALAASMGDHIEWQVTRSGGVVYIESAGGSFSVEVLETLA